MHRQNEIDAILQQVKNLPVEDRVAVAQQILRDANGSALAPPPRNTLSKALGLAQGPGPAPTDDQVKQWLEEDLVAKHLK